MSETVILKFNNCVMSATNPANTPNAVRISGTANYKITVLTPLQITDVVTYGSIGGGVSAQNELLVKPVRDKVIETVTPDMAAELKLRAAELGNNAGMVGAVKYFIDRSGGRNA